MIITNVGTDSIWPISTWQRHERATAISQARRDRRSPLKRKRRIAGPRIAPLIGMPVVQPLSESDGKDFCNCCRSNFRVRRRSEISLIR